MGPHEMRAVGGVDNTVDQVVRLEEFRKNHPGVEITSPRQNGLAAWQAVWDEENGSNTITRYDLRMLLDVLEDRFKAV